MASVEQAVAWAEGIAADNSHGYSQPGREGQDFDCSSLVCRALRAAGFDAPSPSFSTRTMGAWLTSHGWTWHDGIGGVRRGDILWHEGHTAFATSSSRLVEALRSETHSTSGKVGDQDGQEIRTAPISYTSWAGYWRYAISTTTTSQDGDDDMYCIIQPNGANVLMYFDGSAFHDLTHPDDVTALNMVYKATHGGASIPTIRLGDSKAPWASRLHQAIAGGCPHKLVPSLDDFKPRTPSEE